MPESNDLAALLRADTPLLVIETPDEARVVDLFRHVLGKVLRPLYRWSITGGLSRLDLDLEDALTGTAPDVGSTLAAIRSARQRSVFLLFDFHPYLGYPATVRNLREIVQRHDCAAHVVVMVGSRIELAPELERLALRVPISLPSPEVLRRIVAEEAARYAREHDGRRVEVDPQALAAIIRNLGGLDAVEARRVAARLIFDDGVVCARDVPAANRMRFELLNRSSHLHFEGDAAGMDDVAGLARLKHWVAQRRPALAAVEPLPGLDPPRGILLLGVQGCGKSLAAKAIAGGFGLPLLRLDFGALYAKYHGETERNLREALTAAEALAPCVLWIDELEKGLASSAGDGDGGVSRRVLGHFLTWMAERRSRVFMVATANAVQQLPPELLRKGRFDEIFFVDLPDATVRAEIFALHLARRGLATDGFDLPALAVASDGFSGAEIEQAVVAGLYAAHAVARPLDQALLLAELAATRPLSMLMAEQVQALRDWAAGRTVPAH
ncbi:MAG: AAA family ATPase [Xanthomonadales bacterium]|nr:AAA family ATPase [Xanthomonadales bacterium]